MSCPAGRGRQPAADVERDQRDQAGSGQDRQRPDAVEQPRQRQGDQPAADVQPLADRLGGNNTGLRKQPQSGHQHGHQGVGTINRPCHGLTIGRMTGDWNTGGTLARGPSDRDDTRRAAQFGSPPGTRSVGQRLRVPRSS